MFVVVLIIIIAAYDIWKMIKSGQSRKTLGIYITIVCISMLVGTLIAADKPPVSPNEVISSILRSIGWEGTKE